MVSHRLQKGDKFAFGRSRVEEEFLSLSVGVCNFNFDAPKDIHH